MDFELARDQMVEQQVRSFEVLDRKVLDTMRSIPRESFVPDEWRAAAYADGGVPIGHGQRMFSPLIDGRILQAIAIEQGDRVLEIGAGSGYLTACITALGGRVVAIERDPALAEQARENLASAGFGQVGVEAASAPQDLPKDRFSAVVVGGAVAGDPAVFEERLDIGGRLFVVRGEAPIMTAQIIHRVDEARWYSEDLFETRIPHLVGYEPTERFEF